MEFRAAGFNSQQLMLYVSLMKACFPGASKYDLKYFEWLYAANPDGPVLGFDAYENGRLAAHYACVPALATVDGREVRVLLSLNTATLAQFQGQGLFTKLARMTYEAAAAKGFDAIYGIANANSTHGFVRKLGFQLVRPLDALIGAGILLRNIPTRGNSVSFRRRRSLDSLAWRCGNPSSPVFHRQGADRMAYFSAVKGLPLSAYHETYCETYRETALHTTGVGAGALAEPSFARLFLGLHPREIPLSRMYVPVPQWLKPSPLNLIYLSLSGAVPALDGNAISFSYLDFDAY